MRKPHKISFEYVCKLILLQTKTMNVHRPFNKAVGPPKKRVLSRAMTPSLDETEFALPRPQGNGDVMDAINKNISEWGVPLNKTSSEAWLHQLIPDDSKYVSYAFGYEDADKTKNLSYHVHDFFKPPPPPPMPRMPVIQEQVGQEQEKEARWPPAPRRRRGIPMVVLAGCGEDFDDLSVLYDSEYSDDEEKLPPPTDVIMEKVTKVFKENTADVESKSDEDTRETSFSFVDSDYSPMTIKTEVSDV